MLRDISAEAVQLAEHDELGRPAFLEKYGFLKHRSYRVTADKSLRSKAIIAAHGLSEINSIPWQQRRSPARRMIQATLGPWVCSRTKTPSRRLDLGGAHSRA